MHMKLKTPLTATFISALTWGVLMRIFPDHILQMHLRAIGSSPLDLESVSCRCGPGYVHGAGAYT